MKQVELLAPVGKFENALAAIENGANAIFVGGKMFSARYYADNFADDELEQIVQYCKLRGVQVHVTVNTLIKQHEVEQLVAYLGYLNQLGVDAIIVQDLGVARIAKQYYKDLVLHASTQMSAHSMEDVKFLKAQGFERVVLAREVQLDAVREIKENVDIEIETFIHGALCYAYSGQCLMSSMIGGRSGNRGRCAQPCRMTYTLQQDKTPVVENVYMLSPKDICTLSILPQLIESGVDSFKIEGRMKSPEYVAVVTSVYRKYIDLAMSEPQNYKVDPEDMAKLQSIFNRGGFSEGYYLKRSGRSMMADETPKNIGLKIGHVVSYNKKAKTATFFTNKALNPGDGLEIWNSKKHVGTGISKPVEAGKSFTIPVNDWMEEGALVYLSKNHELLKSLKKTYQKALRKQLICGKVEMRQGQPMCLSLSCGKHSVTLLGDKVEGAQNQPITQDDLEKQMTKLGNTPFEMQHLTCEVDEGVYMPVSRLNALRREAVEALEKAILEGAPKEKIDYIPPKLSHEATRKHYYAHVHTIEQLEVALTYAEVEGIYWEWHNEDGVAKKAWEMCQEKQKPFYLALPLIVKDEMWQTYEERLVWWDQQEITGYLIRNLGTYSKLQKSQKQKILDYTFNVMNNEAVAYWVEKGATRVNASMELSKKELNTLQGPLERIIYGHLPVMTTEQCVLGNYGKCIKKQAKGPNYYLEDRKEARWPILTDCKACKMQLLAETPVLQTTEQLQSLQNIEHYRIWFTVENRKSVAGLLEYLFNAQPLGMKTQHGAFLKAID